MKYQIYIDTHEEEVGLCSDDVREIADAIQRGQEKGCTESGVEFFLREID